MRYIKDKNEYLLFVDKNYIVSMESKFMANGFAEDVKAQFNAIREEARSLGVLDINFSTSTPASTDSLECYKRTLEIIKKNQQRYDQNAGEL